MGRAAGDVEVEEVRVAPLGSRLVVAGLGALPSVALVAVGAAVGGTPGLVLAVAGALGILTSVVAGWRLALVIADDALVLRNPAHTVRIAAADAVALRPDRIAGMLGPRGRTLAVSTRAGEIRRTPVLLAAPASATAEAHLVLRRWTDRHGIENTLPRVEFQVAASRRSLLAAGEAVDVRARVRRTDARGWEPWSEGVVRLPARDARGTGAAASWVPAGDRSGEGWRLELAGAARVDERDARFPEEEFFGPDTRFVVAEGAWRTLELALDPAEAPEVIARLRALSGDDPRAPRQ